MDTTIECVKHAHDAGTVNPTGGGEVCGRGFVFLIMPVKFTPSPRVCWNKFSFASHCPTSHQKPRFRSSRLPPSPRKKWHCLTLPGSTSIFGGVCPPKRQRVKLSNRVNLFLWFWKKGGPPGRTIHGNRRRGWGCDGLRQQPKRRHLWISRRGKSLAAAGEDTQTCSDTCPNAVLPPSSPGQVGFSTRVQGGDANFLCGQHTTLLRGGQTPQGVG